MVVSALAGTELVVWRFRKCQNIYTGQNSEGALFIDDPACHPVWQDAADSLKELMR